VPNLLIGMKAMRWCEQPLPQIVLGGSSLKSAGAPKLEFLSSLLGVLIPPLLMPPASTQSLQAANLAAAGIYPSTSRGPDHCR